MNLTIYTDGAARGNPGPAGIGFVIYDENNEIIEQQCKYLGTATNNAAEYQALIAAMDIARKYLPCGIRFFLDAELVVRQMSGVYRVKNEALREFFAAAQRHAGLFERVSFTHIPREKNTLADRLANRAIDQNPAGDNT